MTHRYVSWPIDMRHAHTYTHAFHDSFTGGATLIHICGTTHSYEMPFFIHDSFTCAMTYSHVP